MAEDNKLMEKIVSLAKRRGFVFPGSEIYGGLAGTYDYGPRGEILRWNLLDSWKKKFITSRVDMYPVNADILMNAKIWETSGHVAGFADPMIECSKCHSKFRADEEYETFKTNIHEWEHNEMTDIQSYQTSGSCPNCGESAQNFSKLKKFNMMFKTHAGALEESASEVYLRPETAQGMFVNFKNIMDSMSPKLPFGMAQIGKAFRNEITPRDFLFRKREFEQMEIEYFVGESDWEKQFTYWQEEMKEWMASIGLDMNKVHEVEVEGDDLAHYSKRTVDFEFEYPFGQKELYGLAYRTDYDLKKHAEGSGEKLSVEGVTPHVIEPSFGLDRTVLALLVSAYREDEVGGEERVYLDLKPSIAPYKIMVSPLLKNKPELVEKAQSVFAQLKNAFGNVVWDDNGNIGKRYRRQDEIGTPYCVTVDFDGLEDDTVTVRDRNTTDQERVVITELISYFTSKLND